MGRLGLLIFMLCLNSNLCYGSTIFFAEDQGRFSLDKLDRTYSLPGEYKANTSLPLAFKARRWAILFNWRGRSVTLGSVSIMPPSSEGISNVYLAFDHRPYFESHESCLASVTLALVLQTAKLGLQAGFRPISKLKTRDFFMEPKKNIEEMGLLGWQVKTIAKVLGDKQFRLLEYSLDVAPLSLSMLAVNKPLSKL